MIVGIVGSRTCTDYVNFCKWFRRFQSLRPFDPISRIISGGAKGADSLAARYAKEYIIPITEIKPDWDTHGKSAGFIRNNEIVEKSHGIIAFWDGKSKGTLHTITLAVRAGKWVEIYPIERRKHGTENRLLKKS